MRVLLFCSAILTCLTSFADEGKFLLLLGPSGVGKSTIISHLKKLDPRFVYVSPYTTRALRPNETDKVHVPLDQILTMEKEGRLLTINQIYGIYYATPKDLIDQALADGKFPVLDWPVDKMEIMLENYRGKLLSVYVEINDLDELQKRLSHDGRDANGLRFAAGKMEIENYHLGLYDAVIDLKILNLPGEDEMVAKTILKALH